MNDQSRMCDQLNLWDTPNAIFSPESASGPSLCDKPDGPTITPSGQAHAHASLSARQAKEAGLLTSGTYGPISIGSSNSVALQRSLASKLQVATASLGSTLYKLTWKERVTPTQRLISALRASARRTSGNDCIGWPTPNASMVSNNSDLQCSGDGRATPNKLGWASALTGWPTPTVGNAQGSQMAKDASATGRRPDGSKATVSLNQVASFSGWPTPSARDWKDTGDLSNSMTRADGKSRMDTVPRIASICGPARLMATGVMLTGCDAQTKSGGQLNPKHSLWLMLGPFATAWASCGERVMRSRSGKRKVSSKP